MSSTIEYWLGIDLGTYNSAGTLVDKNGNTQIVTPAGEGEEPNAGSWNLEEGRKEFPSFIWLNEDGSIGGVGNSGKNRAWTQPELVVWGVKRLLGKPYAELRESGELDRFAYRIKPDRSNGQCLIAAGKASYTPVQLCSEILKKIKNAAEAQVGVRIESAVVSVPAYFDPLRVTPIVDAARLAGFIEVKTIPEPVAAALAYNVTISSKPIKVVVFDLGAGTLDVTAGLLYRRSDKPSECAFRVVKNTGDPRLGGIDMDDRLSGLIRARCGLAEVAPHDAALLRRTAEVVKIRLSQESRVDHAFECAGKPYRCVIDEIDFRSSLEGQGSEKNLLDECRRQVMAAIRASDWGPEEIELLLLIGGPTKLPCIRDVLRIVFHSNPRILQQLERLERGPGLMDRTIDTVKASLFGSVRTGSTPIDRMRAVSTGAALSVARKVDDRVPYGYGVEDIQFGPEAKIYKANMLVPRDSPYPFKSDPHRLGWYAKSGLFEFSILQQMPASEVEQAGHEFRFVGVQHFAIKDPQSADVVLEMGYNANRELEVTILNRRSAESVTYVGLTHINSIPQKYPKTERLERSAGAGGPNGQDSKADHAKATPPPDTIERFLKWARTTAGFLGRKLDAQEIRDMLIVQMVEEAQFLAARETAGSDFEQLYNRLNSTLWNAHARGILERGEYEGLRRNLSEFEKDLFVFK